jgi:hypothetical protein
MSFDIFLVCVDHGSVATFPSSIIKDAFAPFIESRDKSSWKLVNCLADVWIEEDEAETDGFMVSRPPGDEDHPFWAALLDIMRKTQTVLFWPSVGPEPHAVVAEAAVIAHMPPDMIEKLGTPALVKSPAEFLERINDSEGIE